MTELLEGEKLILPKELNPFYNFFNSIYYFFKKPEKIEENSLEQKTKIKLPGIHECIDNSIRGTINLNLVEDKKNFITDFEKYNGKKHNYKIEGNSLKYWKKENNKKEVQTFFKD